MTEKIPYQTNEYQFLNPCRECIVRPCCSQKCRQREEFEQLLPIMDEMGERWSKQVLKQYEENSIFTIFKKGM
jgi:hypothetical protein